MPASDTIASVTVTNPKQREETKKWSTAPIQAHGAENGVRGCPRFLRLAQVPPGTRCARRRCPIVRMVCVEGV